ncbi:DMT family transporter [Mycobacterium sp. 050128]|uniref:DMT family transporter n=1 Tax=unclassified Mycobacterium TaxID=2642494 RepID=UPI002ED8D8AF
MADASVVSARLRPPRPGRMLIVTAGWGACFVGIRYGLVDAPILWFAALRALLAGGVLLAVGWCGRRPAPPRSAWPGVVVLGLVNVSVAFAAMFAGTAGVAGGVAAVLSNAQPVLIVLPAWLLYGERPRPRAMAGLVVGFLGLIVAAIPAGTGSGALSALAASVAITASTLLARRLGAGVDVVMFSAWQLVCGGIALASWAAAVEGVPAVSWTPHFVAALLFLALASTALPYMIWFSELQRAPLVTLSAWTILTPVFGVAFSWVLLNDRLTEMQGIGLCLVLAAMPIILLPHRHADTGN